jgi:3-oxoacyl-[acyl-carrier protein] reductase
VDDAAADHESRLVLVLGASGGIGQAMVRAFTDKGDRVVRHYRSRPLPAGPVDHPTLDVCADLTDWVATERMAQSVVDDVGPPDVVVNCTGRRHEQLFITEAVDAWKAVFDSNVLPVYHPTRALLHPMVRRRRGAFINIVSVAGPMASPGQSAYASAKSAIIGLTRTLAREYGRRGVTFNAIAPSLIDTSMTAEVSDSIRQAILDRQAIPSTVTAGEVASTALFLASSQSITGQVVVVDCGLSI